MTQPQREALLDLLIIGIFVDSKLSVAEDAALEKAFKTVGWEGAQPREVFIVSSLSRARRVRQSDTATGLYITSRTAAFTDADSRSLVVDLLDQLFLADGMDDREAQFFARVKAEFS